MHKLYILISDIYLCVIYTYVFTYIPMYVYIHVYYILHINKCKL